MTWNHRIHEMQTASQRSCHAVNCESLNHLENQVTYQSRLKSSGRQEMQ